MPQQTEAQRLYDSVMQRIESASVRAEIERVADVAIEDCGRLLAKGGQSADPDRIAAYWICLVIGL
jgi:hypothetical protein